MKIALGVLGRKDVNDAFIKLFDTHIKLDGGKAWQLIKFRKALAEAGEDIRKSFELIMKDYAIEENGQKVIPGDKIQEWNVKVATLNDQEVELPDFQVKIDDLECDKFSGNELGALEFIKILIE